MTRGARRAPTLVGALISAALLTAQCAPGADAAVARTRSAPCQGADLHPSQTNAAAVDAATVCLIDQVRATYHLRPLRLNRDLQGVAIRQVNEMVRFNYFADNRPSGQTPASLIASTHYAAHAVSLSTGQNLGWATGVDATPASIVAAWMCSPPHREIMLSAEFHDVGVGVSSALPSSLERGRSGAIYAVEFGARWF